ncbi:MAG: N-acetylmuramoyl-L-alanine amidase, partial [Rhodospirillaceae bacterium]|nr:N-acetylmuramoyl-L-alanine amidase [Rhodospirillaceae bacterium]
MTKLALVVGHTKSSPGATAAAPINDSEYRWNKELAEMMLAHAAGMAGVAAKVFQRDGVGVAGAYRQAWEWGAEGSIELHFNAAGPSATGSETLYVTPLSLPLAEAVQDATLTVLGLRDRGVKTSLAASGGRGEQNLMQMGGRPSILTEPFFGSNPADATVARQQKSALARAQLEAAVNVLVNIDAEDHWTVRASALNVRGGPGT